MRHCTCVERALANELPKRLLDPEDEAITFTMSTKQLNLSFDGG